MGQEPKGPPEGVSPKTLWQKLSETPAPSELVPFPRRGPDGKPVGMIRIKVLTAEQFEGCRLRGFEGAITRHRWDTNDKQQQVVPREVISDAIAREVLCIACVDPDPIGDPDGDAPVVYAKTFPSPDSLLKLTKDELAVLFSLYEMVQAKWSPVITGMSPADENAWISRLAEGGSAFPLVWLDSHQRDRFTLSLAQRVRSLSQSINRCLSLESQGTLGSLREALPIDTSYFGEPRSGSPESEDGSDSDLGIDDMIPPYLDASGTQITLDMVSVALLAKTLR